MRVSSPEEVAAWADRAAASDVQRNISPMNHDLNPYCTHGARTCWQRGFDGLAPRTWEGSVDYDTQYQRGAAAARLVKRNLGQCT